MTQSPQWLTTCCQGCVQTNCSGDFGLVPAGSTPITGSANSLSILSPQPQGPTFYLGRHEGVAHRDGITKGDYAAFMRLSAVSLDTFNVSEPERRKSAFVTSLEPEVVHQAWDARGYQIPNASARRTKPISYGL
jgi:hypothetical protein